MKGFQGNRATAYTALARKYVPAKLDHSTFCALLVVAEETDVEPDATIQRYLNLRDQLRSEIYGTELQDGR